MVQKTRLYRTSIHSSLYSRLLLTTSCACISRCLQGGVTVVVDTDATSPSQMPFSLWAKFKRSLLGWNMAARFDTDSSDLNQYDVDLTIRGGPVGGTGVQLVGSANVESRTGKLSSVKLSQSVDTFGGTLAVIPRYNLDESSGSLQVAYGVAGATVTLDYAPETSRVTVTKEFGEKNLLAPSITSDGDVTLAYSRAITDTGVLTATLQPNAFLNLQYGDSSAGYVANIKAPMDGIRFPQGAQFSIRATAGL